MYATTLEMFHLRGRLVLRGLTKVGPVPEGPDGSHGDSAWLVHPS